MTAIASQVSLIPRGPNVTKDGEVHWVYASCDRQVVAFWCQTHEESFPTREHLTAHCREGLHAVARDCPLHGHEACVAKSREPGEES